MISLVACLSMQDPFPFQNGGLYTISPTFESTNSPTVQVAVRTLALVVGSRKTPTIQINVITPTSFRSQLHMKVSSGDLAAEIREIIRDLKSLTITVCTDPPTVADWMPRFSTGENGRKFQVPGWILRMTRIGEHNSSQANSNCNWSIDHADHSNLYGRNKSGSTKRRSTIPNTGSSKYCLSVFFQHAYF